MQRGKESGLELRLNTSCNLGSQRRFKRIASVLKYYGPSYVDGYHDFLPKLGTLINKLVLGKLNPLPQLNPSVKPNNQVNKSNSPNLESLQLVKK